MKTFATLLTLGLCLGIFVGINHVVMAAAPVVQTTSAKAAAMSSSTTNPDSAAEVIKQECKQLSDDIDVQRNCVRTAQGASDDAAPSIVTPKQDAAIKDHCKQITAGEPDQYNYNHCIDLMRKNVTKSSEEKDSDFQAGIALSQAHDQDSADKQYWNQMQLQEAADNAAAAAKQSQEQFKSNREQQAQAQQ